jgi:Fe-S-cluster containining protein
VKPGDTKRVDAAPWYVDGLCFACQACGGCCGGAPGFVWVDGGELTELAAYLGMVREEFYRQYMRRLWRGMSLKEKYNYDCILLDSDGHCRVYEARPLQCRTWPFWPSNLASPEDWEQAARRCPGMGQGPLYTFEMIEAKRLEMEC